MIRVVVIGGGIAGTSVAYELAGEAAVTLVEREPVCGHHSTGRSAALFTECYGDAVVRRFAMASRDFLEHPPDGFSDTPLVHPRPVMFVATHEQETAWQRSLAEYRAMVPTVHGVEGGEAVARCPVLDPERIAGGIVEPHAHDIDVHALHLAYQRGIRARGGSVVTGADVTALHRSGSQWRVSAGGVDHQADVVVDAAGAWCDLVGALAGARPIGLVAKRRTAFTFVPPEGPRPLPWPMVIDVDEQFYFRPEGVHVLGSPCDETPVEPQDVRHDELDVAVGIERLHSVTTLRIRSVVRAWAGLRSFVADHRPVNGWDPDLPGFYWLAGQGGFGIKTSPAMARFATGMILAGTPPSDLVDRGLDEASVAPTRHR